MTHMRVDIPVDARRNTAKGNIGCEANLVGPRREKTTAQPSLQRPTLRSSARWRAGTVVDVGIPVETTNGRACGRDFHARRHRGSRKQVGGTFLSVDGNALALGVLVGEDVVPQVKRLQREACAKQTQDCDIGESWAHGPNQEMRIGDTTQHVVRGQERRARTSG